MGLERGGTKIHIGWNAGKSEFVEKREPKADCLGAEGCDIDPWKDGNRSILRQHERNTFKADRKPDGRHGGSSELFDEAVITSPGADGVLGSQLRAGYLKGREAVIIQPADKSMVHMKGNSYRLQASRHQLEMLMRRR
jgi:hypothetical protein